MQVLQGPSYVPENAAVESLVILLHGYGADGQDLIDLAPFFAQALPNTAFYSPDGPEVCEMSPFGRQWFSLSQTDPDFLRRQAETQATAFEAMYDGAIQAAPKIIDFIQSKIVQHKLSPKDVCLVGFSQGTMMALHIGMRHLDQFAGIVGFSGALVGASKLKEEIKATPPVLLIHGEADEMLPVHAVDLAEQAIIKAAHNAKVIKRPNLPHSIDQEGAVAAGQFLQNCLNS